MFNEDVGPGISLDTDIITSITNIALAQVFALMMTLYCAPVLFVRHGVVSR